MSLDIAKISGREYCNCLALERKLNPVGSAGAFDDAIIIEAPLPWRRDMTQKAGTLPQEMIDLLALWLQDYYAGKGYPHLPLVVVPDPAYSREGYRRVMRFTRPQGMFARFDKVEYLVPVNELGTLIWALYHDRSSLPRFHPYRVPSAHNVRDILVCTHGTIDAACAKFGYPLYKHMRDTYTDELLRVWRVSHFGGHVFAPTLMDMPTGHYWAYIEQAQAAAIVRREGDVAALRDHYRGWAGISSGFGQTAECELWQRYGWRWFDYCKSCEIISQDAQWADVRIRYAEPGDARETVVDQRVEMSHSVETEASTGDTHRYPYPQYRIAESQ
jgi:hypothetical protein